MTKLVRFISTRSPYERAGLKFDRSCKRTPAGFPFVEVDLVGLERMGDGGWREMVRDPAISIEVRNADGVFEPYGQEREAAPEHESEPEGHAPHSMQILNADGKFVPYSEPHNPPEARAGAGGDRAARAEGAESRAAGALVSSTRTGGDASPASSGGAPAGAVGDVPPAPGGRGAPRRGMTSSNSKKGRSK